MAHVLILYATVEGQTARIAQRVAERLRRAGQRVETHEVRAATPIPEPGGFDAVIVGASVHYGRHAAHLRAALSAHRLALESRPGAFFSVSLSAKEHYATKFLRQVQWRPQRVAIFAGALKYRQYGWFKRLLVRAFAAFGGHDTDTSRDYEYTDWSAVEHFADVFAQRLAPRA